MSIAPIIETERLILRPLDRALFDDHFINMSDPRVMAFIGNGQPQSRIEAWRRFCQGAGLWALIGYGYWAFTERATGRMIGMGGLAQFEREMPALDGVPEAGWAFAADQWGKGIATEAMQPVLEWADTHIDAPAIRCIISPNNIASIKVAEKCGFCFVCEAEDASGIVHVFERDHL
jgi:RimJ/RimL family protein N-acetyltransferase